MFAEDVLEHLTKTFPEASEWVKEHFSSSEPLEKIHLFWAFTAGQKSKEEQ